MKRVLIFGSAGFVGIYLAKEFTQNGYEVYGSDRLAVESLAGFMKYKAADILDAKAVSGIIREFKPNYIVNLAAVSSVGMSWNMPQATMEVNVIGALNILEAARSLENIPKVMFIGSSEEYAPSDKPISEDMPLNANNPYGISKTAQERFAEVYRERYGMKIYCVRPFNHTGVGQRETFVLPSFCKQVADIEKSGKTGVIKVGNLAAKRDFSDVRDIVRGYRAIIESNDCKKVYNLGSGKAYSLKELLEYIISLSSQKIEIEVDTTLFRPNDNNIICCNNSSIKNNLGVAFVYSLYDTLKDMYEYYLKN